MAIEERKTKAERRAEARADRKAKAEAAAKEARKRRLISWGSTGAVLIVIVLVLIPTFNRLIGGGDGPQDVEITRAEAEAAREAAGCEVLVDSEPLPDRNHLEPAEAPPADILYANAQVRPTYSGSHFNVVSPPVSNIPRTPIEERSIVHNMEHGAIAVWFDDALTDPDTENALGDWGESRSDVGFSSNAGAAIFTSPYEGTITSGKAIAFRAWGQAMDCETFDQTVADAWLIDFYGSHGIAPERNLAPYPDGTLGYGDGDVDDTPEGEGPQDDESDPVDGTEDVSELPLESVTPSDGGTDATEPAATESEAASPTTEPSTSES